MDDQTTIRRRPDGSIDTGYYVARARRHRARAFARWLGGRGSLAVMQPTRRKGGSD